MPGIKSSEIAYSSRFLHCFFSPLSFFPSMRLRTEDFVGLVGFLGFLGVNAFFRSSSNLRTASSLFCSCDRVSCDIRIRAPSLVNLLANFFNNKSFWSVVKIAELARSHLNVTFVLTLLTCCPPAPPLRENVKTNSLDSSSAETFAMLTPYLFESKSFELSINLRFYHHHVMKS